MQNDASKASSYVDYVDFDFPAILSIDFAFLLNIMLLEAKKWFVPKCSTNHFLKMQIMRSPRQGGTAPIWWTQGRFNMDLPEGLTLTEI